MNTFALRALFALLSLPMMWAAYAQQSVTASAIAPGVWRYAFGTPDSITPVKTHPEYFKAEMPAFSSEDGCPVSPTFSHSKRGVLVSIPLKAGEGVYGFGLQFGSFNHRGTKKTLRVNADPKNDTGDSHAPVPFYVTTEGYGVFVDVSRDVTFYCGNKDRASQSQGIAESADESNDAWNATMSNYQRTGMHKDSEMLIEIPFSDGVDVYVFGGPGMKDAVARYNMFAGGGAVPPRWGLGFWYRGNSNFTAEEFMAVADSLSAAGIACDVFGLETHWQTHAYSSSLIWDKKKFPNPENFIKDLGRRGIHLNMWLQAFTHPWAESWKDLREWSGDFTVWDGLVPDFITPEGRAIYSAPLEKYVDWGLSGFKADECDNSDFTGNWSFPHIAKFPSGADGEQMHNLIGVKFQQTLNEIYRKRGIRTYSLVRSSGALAAPNPFVLYSDLYDNRTFIKGIPQAGFSGLLWCPELRDSKSPEEMLLRLGTAVFSPMCMYNGWFLQGMPWTQYADKDPKVKDKFKSLVDLRMSLIPYLHSAFVQYHATGIPPFRALILDYPEEKDNLLYVSNQYMMGDAMMVAPLAFPSKSSVSVYIPKGRWHNFFSGEVIDSRGENIEIQPNEQCCLVFVKDGTLLPLAKPTQTTADPDSRLLSFRIYGDVQYAECTLYDDPQQSDCLFGGQVFKYDSSTGVVGSQGYYKVND